MEIITKYTDLMNAHQAEQSAFHKTRPVKPVMRNQTPTKAELEDYAKKLEEYELKRPEWDANKKKFEEAERDIYRDFRKETIEEEGLTGHPKVDLAWSIAWERGHSEGFNGIYNAFEELAQLLH